MMGRFLRFFAAGSNTAPLSDKAEIDQKYAYYRRNIIVVITLCYGLGYVCRLALNVVKKPLMDAGVFNAHVGRFFAAGIFLSAVANFGMSLSDMLWLSAGLWLLNGWFQGFGAPSSVVSLASWYSNRERGRYYGIWSTAHSIGEGLTYLGIALLLAEAPKGLGLSWHWGFWTPAAICVFAAFLLYRYLPDRPETMGLPSVADWANDHGKKVEKSQSEESIWKSQLKVISYPSIWILAFASASMYVTRYGINSWGNVYLQEIRGFDLFDANLFIFFNTAAGILGCLAYGFISDKWFDAKRPPSNLLFGLMELLPLFVIFFGPNHHGLLAAALVVYGFGLSGILASLGGLYRCRNARLH